jgi:hypothetical protein
MTQVTQIFKSSNLQIFKHRRPLLCEFAFFVYFVFKNTFVLPFAFYLKNMFKNMKKYFAGYFFIAIFAAGFTNLHKNK